MGLVTKARRTVPNSIESDCTVTVQVSPLHSRDSRGRRGVRAAATEPDNGPAARALAATLVFEGLRMARRSGKRLCLRPRRAATHAGVRTGPHENRFPRSAMTAHPLRLDHLVISARTLDEGTQFVADTLGVAPAGGGAHPLMRTHNRLLNLWGGAYLEVIAIDPQPTPCRMPPPTTTRRARASSRSTIRRLQRAARKRAVARRTGSRASTGRSGSSRWQAQYPAAHRADRADDARRVHVGPDRARRRRVSRAGKAPATACCPR